MERLPKLKFYQNWLKWQICFICFTCSASVVISQYAAFLYFFTVMLPHIQFPVYYRAHILSCGMTADKFISYLLSVWFIISVQYLKCSTPHLLLLNWLIFFFFPRPFLWFVMIILSFHPALQCVAASTRLVSSPCLINAIHSIIHLINEITE